MKIAFVHDWIINIWWAEKVFSDIISNEDFDEWEIFTAYSNKYFMEINWKKIKVNSALPRWVLSILRIWEISNNKIIKTLFDYRNLMFFYPILMNIVSLQIRLFKPQKIVISSFAIAKNISNDWVYKKLYLHSPNQYVWSHYDDYLNKFNGFIKAIFKFSSKYIRNWDKKFTKFDEVEFNSNYTKDLAKEIYSIDWIVKYPEINKYFLQTNVSIQQKDYFIYVGRLVRFVKELDKIIELFNKIWDNLLIVWNWPDEEYLKSIAWPNIIFLGYMKMDTDEEDREKLIKIWKESRWTINITKESFWIVTALSLALWVPIFWLNDWATPELIDDKSWILINSKTENEIFENFEIFKNTNFDKNYIKAKFLKKYSLNKS